jgi:hypothetical protein
MRARSGGNGRGAAKVRELLQRQMKEKEANEQ